MTEVDLIHEWLEKASHDLNTAKVVAELLPDYDDTIAFHCQQAIEKLFKAYLIYLNVEFKPVHDLGYLLTNWLQSQLFRLILPWLILMRMQDKPVSQPVREVFPLFLIIRQR